MYARIEDQQVVQYPYTLGQLKAAYPNVSFSENISDQELAQYGVVRVVATGQPSYDWLTENCVEELPELAADGWEQRWSVMPASAEEIAAREEQVKDDIADQIQQRLDTFAQSRYYDNIVSACSYAPSQHPTYGPEGRYCVQAREDTWDAWFAIEAEIDAGTRPMPHGYEDIEAELPPLVWPV